MNKSNVPLVSVLVTTYNQENYIGDCVLSVVSQNCNFDYEIIVGDDCSTDGTSEIVKSLAEKYPDKIVPVIRNLNLGPTQNYFNLMSKGRGKYFAHLDGDDLWLPNKLREQVDFLELHTECVATYSNAYIIDAKNKEFLFNSPQIPETFNMDFLVKEGNFLFHSSLMYKSEYYPFLLSKNEVLDYYLHIIFASFGSLGYINKPLGAYRMSATTSIRLHQRDVVSLCYLEAVNKARSLGCPDQVIIPCISKFLANIFFLGEGKVSYQNYNYWRQQVNLIFGDIEINVLIIIKIVTKRFVTAITKRLPTNYLKKPILYLQHR